MGLPPKERSEFSGRWREALPEGAKHRLRWFESQKNGSKGNRHPALKAEAGNSCYQPSKTMRARSGLGKPILAPAAPPRQLYVLDLEDECNARDRRSNRKANRHCSHYDCLFGDSSFIKQTTTSRWTVRVSWLLILGFNKTW